MSAEPTVTTSLKEAAKTVKKLTTQIVEIFGVEHSADWLQVINEIQSLAEGAVAENERKAARFKFNKLCKRSAERLVLAAERAKRKFEHQTEAAVKKKKLKPDELLVQSNSLNGALWKLRLVLGVHLIARCAKCIAEEQLANFDAEVATCQRRFAQWADEAHVELWDCTNSEADQYAAVVGEISKDHFEFMKYFAALEEMLKADAGQVSAVTPPEIFLDASDQQAGNDEGAVDAGDEDDEEDGEDAEEDGSDEEDEVSFSQLLAGSTSQGSNRQPPPHLNQAGFGGLSKSVSRTKPDGSHAPLTRKLKEKTGGLTRRDGQKPRETPEDSGRGQQRPPKSDSKRTKASILSDVYAKDKGIASTVSAQIRFSDVYATLPEETEDYIVIKALLYGRNVNSMSKNLLLSYSYTLVIAEKPWMDPEFIDFVIREGRILQEHQVLIWRYKALKASPSIPLQRQNFQSLLDRFTSRREIKDSNTARAVYRTLMEFIAIWMVIRTDKNPFRIIDWVTILIHGAEIASDIGGIQKKADELERKSELNAALTSEIKKCGDMGFFVDLLEPEAATGATYTTNVQLLAVIDEKLKERQMEAAVKALQEENNELKMTNQKLSNALFKSKQDAKFAHKRNLNQARTRNGKRMQQADMKGQKQHTTEQRVVTESAPASSGS